MFRVIEKLDLVGTVGDDLLFWFGKEADAFFFTLRRNGGSVAHEEDRQEARQEVQEAPERPQDLREGKN